METINTENEKYPVKETTYVPNGDKNVIELKPDNAVQKSDTMFLYFTVILAMLPIFAIGMSVGWTSPSMIKLESNDTNINPLGRPITPSEVSTFFGIPSFVGLIGTSLLPKLADVFGRKRSMHLINIVGFLSIVGLAFSNNVALIVLCNTISTTFFSGGWNILAIYITEICEDHNRARFGSLISLFLPIGEFCSFVTGPQYSYRDFTLITSIPLVPYILFFFFAPESLVYSLSKGKEEKCLKGLKKLRSNKNIKELESDLTIIRESLLPSDHPERFNLIKLFTIKECRLAVILSIVPVLSQVVSGVVLLTALLAPILNESGSNLSGDTIAIIVGIVKIFTCIFASVVIEKIGRKKLLLISSFGTGVGQLLLGGFFYLNYINSPFVVEYRWVPLACVLTYTIFFCLGIGPIPFVLVTELFPSEYRTVAFAFITTSTGLVFTVYAVAFPILADVVGMHWCLWVFGCTCFILAILMQITLFETKGKSIVEIQEILKHYSIF